MTCAAIDQLDNRLDTYAYPTAPPRSGKRACGWPGTAARDPSRDTAADVARLPPRRVDVRARPHADLPLALLVEEVIKVARGLVQVEDQGDTTRCTCQCRNQAAIANSCAVVVA